MSADEPATEKDAGPGLDLLAHPLSFWERQHIRLVRRTFQPGRVDAVIRWLQRSVGARWINFLVSNLRHVSHFDRVPPLDPSQSYILVSNHRSLFDLYIIGTFMLAHGLRHRMVYPVRSTFIYDNPVGMFLNGAMSYFAMYPPIFRDRRRQVLNLASLHELVSLLKRGGTFLGMHPEGTRNRGPDPYTLLPAQSGLGRIVHEARVPVIPAFITGLSNNFFDMAVGNFRRDHEPIVLVFGEVVPFGDLLDKPASTRVHREISERALASIWELGQEARAIRAGLAKGARAGDHSTAEGA